MQKDARLDHASNINLKYSEAVVDVRLNAMRQAMISNDHALNIGEYYDKLESLVNSPLFDCFKIMPKPAVHHAHLTACADTNYLI